MKTNHPFVGSLIATFLAAPALAGAQTPADRVGPLGVEGEAIVSVHDGDMLSSAYVDGRLGPRESDDMLTVLSLSDMSVGSVPVSNSVAGAPTAVAVTPDGRYAVVSESFGPRPADGQTFRDLPIGTQLILVDISDLSHPEIADTATVGNRLDGLCPL